MIIQFLQKLFSVTWVLFYLPSTSRHVHCVLSRRLSESLKTHRAFKTPLFERNNWSLLSNNGRLTENCSRRFFVRPRGTFVLRISRTRDCSLRKRGKRWKLAREIVQTIIMCFAYIYQKYTTNPRFAYARLPCTFIVLAITDTRVF